MLIEDQTVILEQASITNWYDLRSQRVGYDPYQHRPHNVSARPISI